MINIDSALGIITGIMISAFIWTDIRFVITTGAQIK
jgi:hypothetical protein